MRLCAELASAEFTALSWCSATGWTTDSKNLFGSHFFFHGGYMMTQNLGWEWSILNRSAFKNDLSRYQQL
jgi:hypothetical protein